MSVDLTSDLRVLHIIIDRIQCFPPRPAACNKNPLIYLRAQGAALLIYPGSFRGQVGLLVRPRAPHMLDVSCLAKRAQRTTPATAR